MFIIKYRKYFYALSIILVALSLFVIFYKGLPLGIQFTGGSLLEVAYPETHLVEGEKVLQERPKISEVKEVLPEQFSGAVIQPTEKNGFIIRTKKLEEKGLKTLLQSLSFGGTLAVEKKQFSFIGPTVGQELRAKAAYAIFVVIIATILYVAYAFRKVSNPVSSWKYSFVTVLALVHDCLIPTGVFVLLGSLVGFEIDVLFVIAILTIFGYSTNDTIVVFDRIRENLGLNQEAEKKNPKKYIPEPFSETVGRSLEQTFTRSINTSVAVLLVVLVLYFLGSASTQHFALVLVIGTIAGAYSSVFVASPLLVTIQKWQEKHPRSEKKAEPSSV